MYVEGDFILDGSGILDIEIGGFTPGSFDVLDITGTAYMPGGNINFSFLDGYDIVTDVGPLQSKELQFLYAGRDNSQAGGRFVGTFGRLWILSVLSIFGLMN